MNYPRFGENMSDCPLWHHFWPLYASGHTIVCLFLNYFSWIFRLGKHLPTCTTGFDCRSACWQRWLELWNFSPRMRVILFSSSYRNDILRVFDTNGHRARSRRCSLLRSTWSFFLVVFQAWIMSCYLPYFFPFLSCFLDSWYLDFVFGTFLSFSFYITLG